MLEVEDPKAGVFAGEGFEVGLHLRGGAPIIHDDDLDVGQRLVL